MDNYEKKYKDALDKMTEWKKKYVDSNVLSADGTIVNDLKEIFPELKESEDEEIIRAIIDALYSHTNSINLLSSRGYQMENIEAWLEKQKDNLGKIEALKDALAKQPVFKPVTWEDVKRIVRIADGMMYPAESLVDAEIRLGIEQYYQQVLEKFLSKKQKEQKPKRERNKPKESWLEKSKYELAHEEELLIKRQKELSEIRALKDKEQKPVNDSASTMIPSCWSEEQKPVEWSEEDVKRLYSIGTQIGFLKGKYSEYQKDIDWLYALAEKMGFHKCKIGEVVTEWKKENIDDEMLSKSKQEWSEEDEKQIAQIERIVKNAGCAKMLQDKIHNWLKSLHPQPQHRDTYYDIIHNILDMLKGMDFMKITPEHRVSLLNDIRVKCKNADECATILDEPHWKPSEEQMKALQNAVALTACDKELARLYNQLKKL